jgi:hypothetical protein
MLLHQVCMIFVIESPFRCSSFKLCLGLKVGRLLGWKEVERYYSNVVQYVVMRGSTPVEEGCDVDLVCLSLFPLFIHSKLIKTNPYL